MDKLTKAKLKGFELFDPNTPVVSRRALTSSHAALYDLLCKRAAGNTFVTYPEAYSIWLKKSCRNVINGVPHSYVSVFDRANDRWRWELKPMDEATAKTAVLQWLFRAIGSMVHRGYLKVVPQVRLV